MAYTPVTLRELRAKFGIEVNASNHAVCPFCRGNKARPRATLHFDDAKDYWRCSKCEASGGVLHLFARYQLGMEPFPADADARKKIRRDMYDFLGYDNPATPRPAFSELPQKEVRLPAPDAQLHAVYSAMAALPMFHLLPEHKEELKRRGLSGNQIEQNGYRSFPFHAHIPVDIVNRYLSVEPALRSAHNAKQAKQVQLGLLAAYALEEKGYVLDGIPGFYKFGNFWCLTYSPGLLIPVRNIYGQIVLWQVRTKIAPKYKTLSCQDRPGAVTENITRCHFPLRNSQLSAETKVLFTEGPLKADIACALSADPCVFAAILGIGNRKDLIENCKHFQNAGVTTLHNALDMDRLTNPHVRKGSVRLTEELTETGLTVKPMYWGEMHATKILPIYLAIAKARFVQVPAFSCHLSVYEKLDLVSHALACANINPCETVEGAQYWEPETKGIDDFLFSKKQRKTHTPNAKTAHMRTMHQTLLRINEQSSD